MTPKIIAEIKKGSPSGGIIRQDVDPVFYAQEYTRLGAKAISVVTASSHFGKKEWITTVAENTSLPILRKDYITTVDQLKETKELGADWVLLIAELLDADKLTSLVYSAGLLGLKPVVEVENLVGALKFTKSEAITILINNRSLATNEIDYNLSRKLLKNIPDQLEIIIASGLDPSLVAEFSALGIVDWFLIGSLFMKSDNLEQTFQTLQPGKLQAV